MISLFLGAATADDVMRASSLAGQKYPLTLKVTNLQASPIAARGIRLNGCGATGSTAECVFETAEKLASFVGVVVSIARLHRIAKAVLLEAAEAAPEAAEAAPEAAEAAPEAPTTTRKKRGGE